MSNNLKQYSCVCGNSSCDESNCTCQPTCKCRQGGACDCTTECSCKSSKIIKWKDTARKVRDVVIFPLISGLMLGLGTVVGRRLGEAWFYPQSNTASK
eukprot:jgi/Galph1/615/GphlegSOOS_G5322.1